MSGAHLGFEVVGLITASYQLGMAHSSGPDDVLKYNIYMRFYEDVP